MKILHIGQMIGGLDVYIRNTISYSADSLEFVIVCGKDDKHKLVERRGKIVKEYGISLYRAINPIYDIMALVQAVQIIRREKPDVIHCHSAKGGVVGRISGFLTGTKTFYTPHAFSFLSSPNTLKRRIYVIIEKMCRLNSKLLACSESEKEMGLRQIGYKDVNAFCWHNSVPNVKYDRATDVTKLNKRYISYIGRPCYQKNTLFLIDLVNRVHKIHPNVGFKLLGVGYYSPQLNAVKRKIADYHLEDVVELLPWLSHEETMNHVADSLFYLTVARYEGLPLAVLEAMSLGKAIVASDVVGNKDCMRDGFNGLLINIDDVPSTVDVICRMIEEEDFRQECGNNSRILFEKEFTIEKRIGLLEAIYKQ